MTTHISATTYDLPGSFGNWNVTQWGLWVQSIIDAFVAVGLVQTADTGQANPAVLPAFGGTNAEMAYLMFSFNDTEQATDPIYIRVKFARGNNSGVPSQGYSIGTGTNGAGVLTGAFSAVYNMNNNSYWSTPNSTYACFSNGAFFLGNGYNANGYRTFQSWIAVERTRDPLTALYDATGFNMAIGGSSGYVTGQLNTIGIRSASPAAAHGFARSCIITPGLAASPVLLNGDKQVFPHFFAAPEVRPRWSTCTVFAADFGTTLSTFNATLLPGFTRQYAQFGSVRSGRPLAHAQDLTTYCLAAVWE
jgi:hypothetical protein